MAKGLTLTVICEAQSLNYDEGFGNLSVLKKLRRGNGEVFTVSSRQSLRYSAFTQGVRQFGWTPSTVKSAGDGDKQVTQHESDINGSEEVDLFGYMKTAVPILNEQGQEIKVKQGNKETTATITLTRRMPVRFSPAISLEPFYGDVEMLTNKYQSDKIQEQPNIANMEHHRSLYRYTVAIDLERIGNEKDTIGTHISPNTGVKLNDELFMQAERRVRDLEVDPATRCCRIQQLLEILKNFFRLIRGRAESLSPLFIIGGVYNCQNPFFMNAIRVVYERGEPRIVLEPLKQILDAKYAFGKVMTDQIIRESTYVGIRDGYFVNSLLDIRTKLFLDANDRVQSPEGMIDKLKEDVCKSFAAHAHIEATKDACS